MFTKLKQLAIATIINPFVASLPQNAKEHLKAHALGIRDVEPGRELLARLYVRGEGLEVGASHFPVPVPRGVKVRYVDFAEVAELRRRHPELDIPAPDIVDDGATLSSVADDSQDFLLSCHVLEHLPDPIGAVRTWLRVLKPGGVLLLAIPDKRFTFDCRREVTTWEHLRGDHEGAPGDHSEEFRREYQETYGIKDEGALNLLVARLRESPGTPHLHVWGQIEMLEFVSALRRYGLDFEVEAFLSYGNEGACVLRKGEQDGRPLAEESLRAARGEVRALCEGMGLPSAVGLTGTSSSR
jgi:SAM-dependent methyltransferase